MVTVVAVRFVVIALGFVVALGFVAALGFVVVAFGCACARTTVSVSPIIPAN